MGIIKMIIKLRWTAVFVLIVFLMSACDLNEQSGSGENPFIGLILTVSDQQMFQRNRFATRISQAYMLYNGTHTVTPYVIIGGTYYPVGEGEIREGILNFTVDGRMADRLVDWDNLKKEIPTLLFWKDVVINKPEIKGNFIWDLAFPEGERYPNGFLQRERIIGTSSTITTETVFYIYVSEDCRITGTASNGFDIGRMYFYRTISDLDLPLKKGFNMIVATETYGTDFNGSAYISLEVRNPLQNPESYKWVLFDF
jgi:hypothetical protein